MKDKIIDVREYEGRVWIDANGIARCDECCNGDRCDNPNHSARRTCTYCNGTGRPIKSNTKQKKPTNNK